MIKLDSEISSDAPSSAASTPEEQAAPAVTAEKPDWSSRPTQPRKIDTRAMMVAMREAGLPVGVEPTTSEVALTNGELLKRANHELERLAQFYLQSGPIINTFLGLSRRSTGMAMNTIRLADQWLIGREIQREKEFFWRNLSGKTRISMRMPDGNLWPKQERVDDQSFLTQKTTFAFVCGFQTEAEAAEQAARSKSEREQKMYQRDVLTQEKLSNVDAYRSMAELVIELVREMTFNRLKKAFATGVSPDKSWGTAFVVMPAQPVYYLKLDRPGARGTEFRKVAIPNAMIEKDQGRELAELLHQAFTDPDGWHTMPDSQAVGVSAYEVPQKMQDAYEGRSDEEAYWAADVALSLNSTANTNIRVAQEGIANLTYGPAIPIAVQMGYGLDAQGQPQLQAVSGSFAHSWHDGAYAQKFFRTALHTSQQRAIQATHNDAPASYGLAGQEMAVQLAAETGAPEVAGYEQEVRHFVVELDQEPLNRVYHQLKLADLDFAKIHNVLGLVLMAAVNVGSGQFVDADPQTQSLLPSIAVLNRMLLAHLRAPSPYLSPAQQRQFFQALALFNDQRKDAQDGFSTPIIMGTAASDVRSKLELASGISDRVRRNLLTKVGLAESMLLRNNDPGASYLGVKTTDFTSAITQTNGIYSAGVIPLSFGRFAIAIRATADAPELPENDGLAEQVQLIWKKAMAALIPPEENQPQIGDWDDEWLDSPGNQASLDETLPKEW